MYHATKKLALDDDKKAFVEQEMKEDQMKMYVLLQIAILCLEIIIPLQSIAFYVYDELGDKGAIVGDKCVFTK